MSTTTPDIIEAERLDLDTVKASGEGLVAQINALVIRDPATLDTANGLLGQIKGFIARWLGLTQPAVDKATESLEAARAVRDALLGPAREAERVIKQKAVAYDTAVRAEAERARRAAEEERRRLQAEADARAREEQRQREEESSRRAEEETRRRQEDADLKAALEAEAAGESVEAAPAAGLAYEPVESSSLAAVAYDPATETLGVRFKNGTEYHYAGVPAATYAALRAAKSVGSAFGALIRGGGYATRRVENGQAVVAAEPVETVAPAPVAAVHAEPVFVPPPVTTPMPRAAGLSFAETWGGEIVDLPRLVQAIAAGHAPINYVQGCQPVINIDARKHRKGCDEHHAQAVADCDACKAAEFVPGVRAVCTRTARKR